jgi:hypothetical protein
MRWDMIQDGWIKMKVLSIVIEWSIVDNLVTSENKGISAEIFKKKKNFPQSSTYYSILDISKEMVEISWHHNLRVLQVSM